MATSKTYEARVPLRAARHHIRDVDYRVNEWGDPGDKLIVMLHGWGDAGSTFQFLVDELRGSWFVIAPDWRGFGETRHRARNYWFPDYLADLDELGRLYSPDEPLRIVGHSMGGNVAGLYAGSMPDRVRAFVNIEGFGLADSDPGNAPAHYRQWIEHSRTTPAFSVHASFDELARKVGRRCPGIPPDRALFVSRQWAEEDADGEVRIKADPAHKLPNAVQYRRAEAVACWEKISAPVLLVTGGGSDFDPEHTWVDPDTRPFRGAELVVIEGAGHMVHFEQPARLAATIEKFLGENP